MCLLESSDNFLSESLSSTSQDATNGISKTETVLTHQRSGIKIGNKYKFLLLKNKRTYIFQSLKSSPGPIGMTSHAIRSHRHLHHPGAYVVGKSVIFRFHLLLDLISLSYHFIILIYLFFFSH